MRIFKFVVLAALVVGITLFGMKSAKQLTEVAQSATSK